MNQRKLVKLARELLRRYVEAQRELAKLNEFGNGDYDPDQDALVRRAREALGDEGD